MKKFGLISVVAGAVTWPRSALPSGAGRWKWSASGRHHGGYGYVYGNNDYPWFNQLFPTVRVPQVDTSVHH